MERHWLSIWNWNRATCIALERDAMVDERVISMRM